jgi:hypothetical protein
MFDLSYEWYIPFTYSIEKLSSSSSKANDYNMLNMHDRIVWIEPGQNRSK